MTVPPKRKILVVDDDPLIRRVVSQALSTLEYEVAVADAGAKGLQAAKADLPDLILLDVMMPGMDGYQVCQQLRSDPQTSAIPVIMLTAMDQPDAVIKGLKSGADDYLTKPFNVDTLTTRIQAHLRRTEREIGANPLTTLPGNPTIEHVIQERLDRREPIAVMYIDLTHFKSYNDEYGWLKGDLIIKLLAKQIVIAVHECGGPQDFIGHVGGDDFVAVSTPDNAERIVKQVIARFDELIPNYYSEQDRARGYIEAIDRRGKPFQAPIVTVSIGVVTNRQKNYQHVAQISAQAAEVKKYVKSLPGSHYAFDRRQK